MDPQVAKDALHKETQEYLEFKQALAILGDRWSALILLCLFDKPHRFVDIQKFAEGINSRTLTQRLHMLEDAGLVTRKVYKEFPPRAEYALTQKAWELKASIMELKKWARKYCSSG